MSVAKLDKNGEWVKRVGKGNMAERGIGAGRVQQPARHRRRRQGNIYVADRGNRRVQVLDSDLNFVRNISIDIPAAAQRHGDARGRRPRRATLRARRAVGACASRRRGRTRCSSSPTPIPGRIYKLSLDGKVLGFFGTNGKQPKQFNWIHAMACPTENSLFVGEVLTWRIQKITLKPGAGQRIGGR